MAKRAESESMRLIPGQNMKSDPSVFAAGHLLPDEPR
jgi:hypothetical protein